MFCDCNENEQHDGGVHGHASEDGCLHVNPPPALRVQNWVRVGPRGPKLGWYDQQSGLIPGLS